MKTWKTFIPVVCFFALAVGYGLTGCGDDGDAARNDDPAGCQDKDGDGYGNPSSPSCVNSALDCDDNDADVRPRAPELCDGIDNQCPGDLGHGIVDDDAVCLCSFDGGSFTFSVENVDDDCPGVDVASLFPPAELYGPVALPGFQELPATIGFPFGPPIGTVPVSIYSGGDDIRIAGTQPIEVSIPGIGDVSATVTGTFCPTLRGQVLEMPSALIVRLTSPIACEVLIEADGTPQGG